MSTNNKMDYWKYFFGTPKRLTASLVVIGIVLAISFPNALAKGLETLTHSTLNAIGPLIAPILTILIVFAGLRIILGKK